MGYLNLDRRFIERQDYDHDELIAAQIRGKMVGWNDVLQSRCSVVVAPANFGKTTEMQQKAQQLRDEGSAAVFVALRRLADRRTLEKALTDVERDAFRAWKAAPNETITVFVDSLDEAGAGKHQDIQYLVQDVADALGWPNDSVRWVVSSRPAMLTSDLFQQLKALLTKSSIKTRVEASSDDSSSTASSGPSVNGTLRLFSMAPLQSRQAASYLEGKKLASDAEQLVSLAHERGLSGFTRSPGGLEILSRIDIVSNPPASLTEVFDRVVSAIETRLGDDPRLTDAGRPATNALSTAVQRLAAAAQICQRVNIEISESPLAIPLDAISARLITSSLLDEAATRQLLGSQLFIDAGFHQVKVYPDELLPYLAAKRLAVLVESLDQAERLLDNFTWAAPSGEQGVHRVHLPMMGWLATLNSHCREVLLRKEPQALAFFGDLRNAAVPLAAAREALTKSIERLVRQGDRPGRGMFSLTTENHWQAGPERLVPTISKLYREHQKNNWAREILTDIATVCKLGSLHEQVLRRHASNYTRLLSDPADVGYLLALGRQADRQALAAAALSGAKLSDSVAGLLVRELSWKEFSPSQLAQLLHGLFVEGPRGFYLAYSIESSDVLGSATDAQLYRLARGLIVRLVAVKAGSENARSRYRAHYVDLVAKVFEALVSRTTEDAATRIARLYLVFRRVVDNEYLGSEEIDDLVKAASRNAEFRIALLTSITQRHLEDHNLWLVVYGDCRAADYSMQDIRAVDHPQLTRVHSEWQAQCADAVAKKATPKVSRLRESRLTVDPKSKRYLKSVLPSLRNGTAEGALEWIACWLPKTHPASRYGEVNFEAFERAADKEISDATRQGMARLWRENAPKYDEDRPDTTYHIAIAGLQGLHLELGDGSELPRLSDKEIRRALRYGLLEINGYPKWFWPLVESCPNVTIPELVAIAENSFHGPTSKKYAENLFASVPNAPLIVKKAIARPAWDYLVNASPTREYLVDSLLDASLSTHGDVPEKEFQRVALQKMKAAYQSPLSGDDDAALQAQRSEAMSWARRWLISYPLRFRNAVTAWGGKDALAVRDFLFHLAADFGRQRDGVAEAIAKSSDEGVMALEDLFLYIHWAVNPVDDPEHPENVTYAPGPRDDAARFRSAILQGIAQANTQAAYEVLGRIHDQLPPGDKYQDYLRRIQFELRERQFSREPVAQVQFDQFEREFRGDVTGATSFAMAVHADLRAVQYDIERGEHSLRSFFSEVNFTRLNKPGAAGDEDSLALEVNFQRLLASELNHHARGRYSVTMESHTAEAKRRDVLCSRNDWRASIELKMSERWTLPDYVVALEKQLVGQYMRHRKASVGFLVLVLQRKDRRWTDASTGKKLTFQDVIAILEARAQALEAKDRTRYLRIIGVDATKPEDFRGERSSGIRSTRLVRKGMTVATMQ